MMLGEDGAEVLGIKDVFRPLEEEGPVEFFGNDSDMSDAEVELHLAVALMERMDAELAAKEDQWNAAAERLAAAQDAVVLEDEEAKEEAPVLTMTAADSYQITGPGYELATLADDDDAGQTYVYLLRRFTDDRDWFIVDTIKSDTVKILKEFGLL